MKTLATSIMLAAALILPAIARADTVIVGSQSVIYAAGGQSSYAPILGASVPPAIALNGVSGYVTFSSVIGSIILNVGSGSNANNADGVGAAASSSSNSGFGSISGIAAPGAGYLTGVFLAALGPTGPAPAALDFTTGAGTAFTSLSPLLDQTFFIGDGLTGNGTGQEQTFYIPKGALELYLGISDACGYNGGPGCYTDNSGAFSATYSVTATPQVPPSVPEPSSLVLLGTGLVGLMTAVRRRCHDHVRPRSAD